MKNHYVGIALEIFMFLRRNFLLLTRGTWINITNICVYTPISGVEVTKQAVRKKVWDYLEKNNFANFPRPVHGRIPNFKGAPEAAERLSELDIFKCASTIKVSPDKPQEKVRFLALEVSVLVLRMLFVLEYYIKENNYSFLLLGKKELVGTDPKVTLRIIPTCETPPRCLKASAKSCCFPAVFRTVGYTCWS
jgi:hypothetical protein